MERCVKRSVKRVVRLGGVVAVLLCGMMAFCFGSSLCGASQAVAQQAATGGAVSGSDQGVYAPAPVETPQQPGFGSALMNLLPMLLLCMVIFHFMVIRPQETKAKAHKELMDSLKKGDEVATSSGIIGKVATVEKDVIGLDIAPSVRIRVERPHIAKRMDASTKANAA